MIVSLIRAVYFLRLKAEKKKLVMVMCIITNVELPSNACALAFHLSACIYSKNHLHHLMCIDFIYS